jgi:hypothetical protein
MSHHHSPDPIGDMRRIRAAASQRWVATREYVTGREIEYGPEATVYRYKEGTPHSEPLGVFGSLDEATFAFEDANQAEIESPTRDRFPPLFADDDGWDVEADGTHHRTLTDGSEIVVRRSTR